MNKEQAITSFMKAVKTYTTAIDKTAKTNIAYKKAVYALEDAVNQIYRDVDVKELGSNAEARNAKVSEQTQDLIVAKREAEYKKLRTMMINLGCNMDPHQAFLTRRGLKTMGIRRKWTAR